MRQKVRTRDEMNHIRGLQSTICMLCSYLAGAFFILIVWRKNRISKQYGVPSGYAFLDIIFPLVKELNMQKLDLWDQKCADAGCCCRCSFFPFL